MKRPVALLFLLAARALWADERILSFKSQVEIKADGQIQVSESITVRAEGNRIRRGIYRDIPTQLKRAADEGWLGSLARFSMPFEFLGAQRDGHEEPWHSQALPNGTRIYLGHKGTFLQHGVHRYEIRYAMSRALGFFEGHDELYWNATGNAWDFPIDEAEAEISLPAAAAFRLAAYTGPRGAKGADFEARDLGQGKARFKMTRMLNSGEGLTIVAGFPKGLVHEADSGFLRDWGPLILALLSLALALGYYLMTWTRHGLDPAMRPIVPLFYPPKELGPAVLAHADERPSSSGFPSTLLQLAVMGRLSIKKGKSSSQWILTPLDKSAKGLDAVQLAAMSLFEGLSGVDRDSSRARDASAFQSALIAHDSAVSASYRSGDKLNLGKFLPAALSLLACSLLIAWMHPAATETPSLVLGGAVQLLQIAACISMGAFASGLRLGRPGLNWNRILAGLLIGLALFVFSSAITAILYTEGAPLLALHAFAAGGLSGLFAVLLPQPSVEHQRLRDEIAGFTQYLGTAERHRLEKLNPPEDTPALFERYLPYALALGVENTWAQRFESIMLRASADPGRHSPGFLYLPYSSMGSSSFGDFGSSFSGAISSASAPPSSSGGGFGGGGGSGGGGGGGGGGGW